MGMHIGSTMDGGSQIGNIVPLPILTLSFASSKNSLESRERTTVKLSEYQRQALTTAVYPRRKNNLPYAALGLNGEAGEVAEHAKKMIRDDEGELTPERREKVRKELGDVLWYIAACADEAGLDLDDVAQANLDKLFDRQTRGVLNGAGDDR